ncbi:MAG: hypothetical protein QOI25_5429 [Mycobacterium sp.]|nr:hypothetical protein [Mycobacterium sp.]
METPLTWPASAAASHDHVCVSEWRVPSGQLWPSGLSTVIVQRAPASCASPLHPLELVMCATHPPDGGHVELAVQDVWAPGAPLRFNEYIPLKSSADAGLANPKENPAATRAAVSPRLMVMVSFRAVASHLLRRLGSSQHNADLAPNWAPAVRVLVVRHSYHSANSQNLTGRRDRMGRGYTIPYCAPGYPSALIGPGQSAIGRVSCANECTATAKTAFQHQFYRRTAHFQRAQGEFIGKLSNFEPSG